MDCCMKRFVWLLIALVFSSCDDDVVDIHIVETTDLHGSFFGYDFAKRAPSNGSLAQVAYFVDSLRQHTGDIVLLDNGDILQGDPVVYYSNYIQKIGASIVTRILASMAYDAVAIGNHDIETGYNVFDPLFKNSKIPWLGANIVDSETQEPAYGTYHIVEKKGVKIAILGLTTPGIPDWLPERLYHGLKFKDMVETAEKSMEMIQKEKPDIVVGLFHAGLDADYDGNRGVEYLNPNATLALARQVPGFDVVFAGHDHKETVAWVENVNGDSVLIVNGGSHGKELGHVVLKYDKAKRKVVSNHGFVVDLALKPAHAVFVEKFAPYLDSVKQFFYKPVGALETNLCPQKSLFEPTEFMQFIHEIQLNATQADVSLSAPLQIRHCIDAGEISWSDVFSIYRFENYLACLDMSIGEIDGFLEYAVNEWFNTMESDDDSMLLYDEPHQLKGSYFNFSSAFGIDYVIDVTKPIGDKVTILAVDGRKFFTHEDTCRVAINSYRLVGGGGHLPKGCGISRAMLNSRNVWVSERPIKSLIIDFFNKNKSVKVGKKINWRVVPQQWVEIKAQEELSALGLLVE